MTNTILSEKDMKREMTQGNSPRVESKMAGFWHTLSIPNGYGSSMARVCQNYGRTMAELSLFCLQ